MCNFLSALVLRSGEVLTHWALDSHSDLARYFKLPDDHFAKVELRPADWFDAETWTWHLDEETAPSWWEDVAGAAERSLRARAAKMILREGDHELILDGCWIVGGDARLRDVRGGRIIMVADSASIEMTWQDDYDNDTSGTVEDEAERDERQQDELDALRDTDGDD